MDDLVALLREDAVLRMPPQPSITSAAEIVGFFAAGPCHPGVDRVHVSPTWANGRPAVAMHETAEDGSAVPHGVLVLEVEGETDRRARRVHRPPARGAVQALSL